MKKLITICAVVTMILAVSGVAQAASITKNYSDQTLALDAGADWSWKVAAGNFADVWDLTQGNLTISFTLDLTGLNGTRYENHAYTQFGIRDMSTGANWHGGSVPGGQGVWATTDHQWIVNALAPHPDSQGLHDKLILQRTGGNGEGDYNLYKNAGVDTPFTPADPFANYGVWFDRDGVDQWQSAAEGAVDGGTFNTLGVYDIVLTLTATSDTTGTAYMTINGIQQGFDGYNPTSSVYPAGMTFSGDLKNMQVFYNIGGWTGPDTATFSNIEVTGIPEPATMSLLALGGLAVLRRRRRK